MYEKNLLPLWRWVEAKNIAKILTGDISHDNSSWTLAIYEASMVGLTSFNNSSKHVLCFELMINSIVHHYISCWSWVHSGTAPCWEGNIGNCCCHHHNNHILQWSTYILFRLISENFHCCVVLMFIYCRYKLFLHFFHPVHLVLESCRRNGC